MAFNEIAPQLMNRLMADYGLTREQAAGFVGNLAHESGGFGTLQEVKPLIPGSRGGYGYAQWTGPRRKQFEAWTSQNNLDPRSFEANYGFLRHELDNTSEGAVLGRLRQAPDVATAAQVVEKGFLRPGIPHSASRVKWANRALGGESVQQPTQPTQMAQAAQEPRQAKPAPGAPPQQSTNPVAALLGAPQRSPMGLLAMLGDLQQQPEAPPPDPRQSFAGNYAWARQNGWRV